MWSTLFCVGHIFFDVYSVYRELKKRIRLIFIDKTASFLRCSGFLRRWRNHMTQILEL